LFVRKLLLQVPSLLSFLLSFVFFCLPLQVLLLLVVVVILT
jgi:hypothetical protein